MEQAFTFSVDRGPASFLNTRAILCVHSQYNICSSQCKYISVYTVCQAGHVFGFAKIGFCEVTKHNLESCTKLLSVITIRAAKFRQIQICHKTSIKRVLLVHTHHMRWYLFHLGSRCTGSGVELVDEETWELIEFYQVYCLLEVFFCLTRKTADYVCGNGYTWNPKRDTETF